MTHDDKPVVYYDLELTGNHSSAEIIQIGAICGKNAFSEYITPRSYIRRSATKINGLKKHQGFLYKNGNLVLSVPLIRGLIDFLEFLSKFGKCILVAHGGRTSDHKYIIRDINDCNLSNQFCEVVTGLADSIDVFRHVLGNDRKLGLRSLANDYLHQEQDHDALDDAKLIRSLVRCLNISREIIGSYTFPLAGQKKKLLEDFNKYSMSWKMYSPTS